jgi:hypothetical protein
MFLFEVQHLVEELRIAPDSSALFPKGKWATIQALQSDILRCAATNPW